MSSEKSQRLPMTESNRMNPATKMYPERFIWKSKV
jgi:hypothetical protein